MSINFDQFNSVVSLFQSQSTLLSDNPYLWKKLDGKFIPLSWSQTREQVESIAKGLINLGILKGDRVVILSENRPEWQIADLAIMPLGQFLFLLTLLVQLKTMNILLIIPAQDVCLFPLIL